MGVFVLACRLDCYALVRRGQAKSRAPCAKFDIADNQLSAVVRPVLQEMPRFCPMKGDAERRRDGLAKYPPAVRAKAAGDIHRDHRAMSELCHVRQKARDPGKVPRQRAGQTRAKKGVNHHRGTRGKVPLPCGLRKAALHEGIHAQARGRSHPHPPLIIHPCIRRHPFGRPMQEHLHLPPQPLQQPRDHEPVAAVVPRPAQHHGATGSLRQFRPFLQYRLHHALPGALHQLQPGHFARRNRRLFDGAHLGGGQQFCHRGPRGSFQTARFRGALPKFSSRATDSRDRMPWSNPSQLSPPCGSGQWGRVQIRGESAHEEDRGDHQAVQAG